VNDAAMDLGRIKVPAGYRMARDGEDATHGVCRCGYVLSVKDESHRCLWVMLVLHKHVKKARNKEVYYVGPGTQAG
jgi:hypothetical protein